MQSYSCVYVLSLAAFCYNGIVTETIWLTKLKVLTFWLLKKKLGLDLELELS